MLGPSVAHDVMIATLFGAGIVVCGAGYAIFLALSRLAGLTTKHRMSNFESLVWYGLLVLCVIGLATHLDLRGWWLGLIALMLLGYFLAPRFMTLVDTHSNRATTQRSLGLLPMRSATSLVQGSGVSCRRYPRSMCTPTEPNGRLHMDTWRFLVHTSP